VEDLARRVEEHMQQRYGEHYAGVEVSNGRVVLYRKPSPQVDAAARALAGGTTVVIRDAPHSARELERLRDSVLADAEQLRRLGVVLSSVAVRHDGTAVEIGAVDVERARRELARRHGATAPIRVVAVGPIAVAPS
jgi:hypothetical protein